jgi:hypothetical protein
MSGAFLEIVSYPMLIIPGSYLLRGGNGRIRFRLIDLAPKYLLVGADCWATNARYAHPYMGSHDRL